MHGSLLVHEQRMQEFQTEEQVLKMIDDDRPPKVRGGRNAFRGGRNSRGCKGTDRQSFNKATIECFKCHKLCHFQYECSDWEKKANYA